MQLIRNTLSVRPRVSDVDNRSETTNQVRILQHRLFTPRLSIKRTKARPGYHFVTLNGKLVEVRDAPTISLDNRSSYQKELDARYTEQKKKLLKQQELDRRTELVANAISPSHHVGALIAKANGSTDRPYMGEVINGPGLVSEQFNREHPILSAFTNFGFDLASPNMSRYFNSVSRWRPWIPRDANRYYRIVGGPEAPTGDAIANANLTGQLRSSTYESSFNPDLPSDYAKTFPYMMFSKGKPWEGSTGIGMGVGKTDRVIVSKPNTGDITWEQSNIDFRHKGHSGIFRPRFNGQLDWVPNQYFSYYEKGPLGIGWVKRDFTNTALESMRAMDYMLDGAELPKIKTRSFNLSKDNTPNNVEVSYDNSTKYLPVRRYLQKYGIDDSKYSNELLLYLLDQHRSTLDQYLSGNTGRYVLVDGTALVYDNGLPRGGATYGTNENGLTIGMVKRSEDLGKGYKGISEDAYNGLIQIAHDYFNLPGLTSGRQLLSPEITVGHVWPKFNEKIKIGDYGKWYWNHGRDVEKTGSEIRTENNPVMLIYGRSNNTPVKSPALFDPRAIKGKEFVIDMNNSNPFMKKGGKINNFY